MASNVNKFFTLVFLKKNNSILLGLKTRGLGKGLWNGFGGKLEPGESFDACAKRELMEECNLLAKSLKQVGVVKYIQEKVVDVVYVYTCHTFEGEAGASEEMNPIKWYDLRQIPWDQMWPDAKSWYPSMLNDRYFSAVVVYNSHGTIESENIVEHDELCKTLQIIP